MRNNLSETYADFSASYNQPVISTRKNLVIWKGSTMALLGSRNYHYQSTTQNQLGPCLWLEPLTQVLVDSSRVASRREPPAPREAMSPLLKLYGHQLGPKLPPNASKLGPSCAISEPSWAEVGAQVGWSKLGRSWSLAANVAAMSDRNGAFGRFWADLQDVQITRVPWAQPSLAAVRFDHLRQYDFNHLRQ